jgi:hypothetical protein
MIIFFIIRIREQPLLVVLPMHQHDLHFITKVSVQNVKLSITTIPPPSPFEIDPLSPERIIWITLGTIFIFVFCVSVLYHLKGHFERHPNTVAYLRPTYDAFVSFMIPHMERVRCVRML